MEWQATWGNPFEAYLQHFHDLIGDKRTGVTLREVVWGIIVAGSLVFQKIVQASSILAAAKEGARRVRRFARGESTQRSRIDAAHLTERLRQRGIDYLLEKQPAALWLILDCSDLRKPCAEEMPVLIEVKALNGDLVSGYRTVNVLGIVPKRRGLLYHHLFSSKEDGFISQPLELQAGIQAVQQALQEQEKELLVTWIMDSEIDDVAIWRTIWEPREHLVCRLKHFDRLVEFRTAAGEWQAGSVGQACGQLRLRTNNRTRTKVQVGRQRRPKMQTIGGELRATPIRLTYDVKVCRPGAPGTA